MADEADDGTKERPIVLVVEDDAQVRLMIEVALTDEGFHVLEAATADDAQVLLAANADVRVLLTDVEMCPSSDDLGQFAVFRSGGSGPSGVRG